jgi:hypothetical protein
VVKISNLLKNAKILLRDVSLNGEQKYHRKLFKSLDYSSNQMKKKTQNQEKITLNIFKKVTKVNEKSTYFCKILKTDYDLNYFVIRDTYLCLSNKIMSAIIQSSECRVVMKQL